MEPTNNLSGGHCSRTGDYGCPAWTFNQQEQEEDLMSSLFLLYESQSPQPSWLWQSLPSAEGFAGPENFGDGVQISPLDEMPCLPFVDGQISSLDEVPCIPAAVVEETNYAPARAAPGADEGQSSYNLPLTSTTFDDDLLFCSSEAEVQQLMMSLEPLLHPQMALDALPNTTKGGPAARSHAAHAVPPVVQHGTSTTADELAHPQPLLSLVDEEVQIQQMTPTIPPSQPPSPTLVINPAPYKANHAASAPMGSQGTLIPPLPHDHQEADILNRASTRRRAIKSRGLPSRLQDGYGNLLVMGMDMIRQFGRYIGKIMKEEKDRESILWHHFWRTPHCKCCGLITVICQYCNTVMGYFSAIVLLSHLESCECYNNIHLLPASSGASNETSQALQIKEIVENPNDKSEPIIETDNSNCATAARVDTQGTNAVVLSPWQQHQLPMDRKEQMATILSSSEPCCGGLVQLFEPLGTWWVDLIIRLSESSCYSSTTKSTHDGLRLKFFKNKGVSTHDGFRLKFSKNEGVTVGRASAAWKPTDKIVRVQPSAAWMHVSEKNSYKDDDAYVWVGTCSGLGYLLYRCNNNYDASAPDGFADSWQTMYVVLRRLGFRKEFTTHLVIYALGWVNGCNLRLRSPARSSNKGKSIVEQGDVSSGKQKRKPARPPSKVWNHFTKEVVEVEGSMVTVARCNHCGSELKAGSASHGTTHLARHVRSIHPDELAKSPL